jgi:hypothetical protein
VEIIASEVWRHSDPETPAPALILDLRSTLGAASATVVVDEGDNHPLALDAPRLELPLFRLRYFYPGKAKLTLLYGNDMLSPPQYDIQLLAPQLVGVSSRELTLDQEIRSPANPAGSTSLRVFWATLIVAVLVVLALLVRLLRVEKTA